MLLNNTPHTLIHTHTLTHTHTHTLTQHLHTTRARNPPPFGCTVIRHVHPLCPAPGFDIISFLGPDFALENPQGETTDNLDMTLVRDKLPCAPRMCMRTNVSHLGTSTRTCIYAHTLTVTQMRANALWFIDERGFGTHEHDYACPAGESLASTDGNRGHQL